MPSSSSLKNMAKNIDWFSFYNSVVVYFPSFHWLELLPTCQVCLPINKYIISPGKCYEFCAEALEWIQNTPSPFLFPIMPQLVNSQLKPDLSRAVKILDIFLVSCQSKTTLTAQPFCPDKIYGQNKSDSPKNPELYPFLSFKLFFL